jgi:MFS family permease
LRVTAETGHGEPEQAKTGKPRPLLLNRDYLGWWTGNTVSSFGTSISGIAFPLLVLFSTGSVAKAGLITAANLIGSVVTTLWGGALADRVSRKAIMITGPLIQAVALGAVAVLAHSGRVPIAALAGLACLSGLARGFASGAGTAALRRIVPQAQLATASSQMFTRDMAAEIIGSPTGGFLFALARWIPFGADAVSYLFASLGAALIRRPLGPDRTARGSQASMLGDIAAGVSFVRRQPFLRFVFIWSALINIVGSGFFLVFIALVRYRGGGPTEVGFVTAVALVGGVAGALVSPLLLRKVGARLVIYAALWAFVAAFAAVALVPQPWEIGVALLVGMIGLGPINIVIESYMIPLVPDTMIGRVSAATSFGSQSLQWTGPLLAGFLADLLGPPGGALALLAAFIPFAVWPHLSRSLGVLDQPVASLTPLPDPSAPDPADAAAAGAAPAGAAAAGAGPAGSAAGLSSGAGPAAGPGAA